MTHTHTRIDRLAACWKSAEKTILGLSIITMSLLVIGNVASRHLFNASWAFTEEIGGLLLIVITFGGLSYAAEQRRHISMSAMYDLLSPRGQSILARIIDLVTALLMLGMAYIALRYVVQISESGDASSVLQIPMFIPLVIIPLGFFLTSMRYLWSLFAEDSRSPDDLSPHAGDSSTTEEC